MNRHESSKYLIKSAKTLYEAYTTPTSERLLAQLLMDTLEYPNEYKRSGLSARAFLNSYVLNYYPNEMAIKTSFVDNVLIKQGKTNVSIFELPVGESRVDICKVSGSTAAYEIKTDLDSFTRLEKQLSDYYDVFEYVSLIVSENRWKSLPIYVPTYCGIYTYRHRKDGRYSFKLRRAPLKQLKFDPKKQLSIMPKSMISQLSGLDDTTPIPKLIDQCLYKYDRNEINCLFKRFLKKQYGERWEFLKDCRGDIYEIDYEWFFRNNLDPTIIY